MIWVKTAKRYLAAFAAGDMKTLESMYADNVSVLGGGFNSSSKVEVMIEHKFFEPKPINIIESVYKDKYIVIEFETNGFEMVSVIRFNDYGKISSVRHYERQVNAVCNDAD